MTKGKSKIIEYYNSRCDFILKEAQSKGARKEFDEAIVFLLSVPEVCKECFDKSQDMMVFLYHEKMENECRERIQASKIAMTEKIWEDAIYLLYGILPDVSCYEESQKMLKEIEDMRCSDALGRAKGAWAKMDSTEAAYWLSEISTISICSEEAIKLGNEIKSKLKQDEDKEWDFQLKKQQDNTNVQNASIRQAEKVGVAYGTNQPKNFNYNVSDWFRSLNPVNLPNNNLKN